MSKPALFSQNQLTKIVGDTFKSVELPAGHSNALVATMDDQGTKVLASFKLGTDARWQITGAFEHDWSGSTTVGGSVVYSW